MTYTKKQVLPALHDSNKVKDPDLTDVGERNYTSTILKYANLSLPFSQLDTNAKRVVPAINELYNNRVIANPPIPSSSGYVITSEDGEIILSEDDYIITSDGEGGGDADPLNTIKIDGIVYKIVGGGGGVYYLKDLNDVNIQSPTSGQTLRYDSATERWINVDGGGDYTAGVGIYFTDNSVINAEVGRWSPSKAQMYSDWGESGGSPEYQWERSGDTEHGNPVYVSCGNTYQETSGDSICTFTVSGYNDFTIYVKQDSNDTEHKYVVLGYVNYPVDINNCEKSYKGEILSDYVAYHYSLWGSYSTIQVMYHVEDTGSTNTDRGYIYAVAENKVTRPTSEIFNDYDNNLAGGGYAHAEGYKTQATAWGSHAEGENTIASGYGAHAEGWCNTASDSQAHAEGNLTKAQAPYAHAEGSTTTASGAGAHAEGGTTVAYGTYSHAEGSHTTATNQFAHSEGVGTTASGVASHAEGWGSAASNGQAHAEGYYTTASNAHAHSEGHFTTASGDSSHAEGSYTNATNDYAHSEGYYTTASGQYSHSEGYNTLASGRGSHAEGCGGGGYLTLINTASGVGSHVEGYDNIAAGDYSHVEGTRSAVYRESGHAEGSGHKLYGHEAHIEGSGNFAIGMSSHTEGAGNHSIGDNSHIEGAGNKNTSQSRISHTEGAGNTLYSRQSHMEGAANKLSGEESHIEGGGNMLHGFKSHLEGGGNIAYAMGSHIEGKHNVALGYAQHIEGAYNRVGYATTPGHFTYGTTYAVGDIVGINSNYYGVLYNENEPNTPAIFRCTKAPGQIQAGNGITLITPTEWNSSTTYHVGDVVRVSGCGFYCAYSEVSGVNPATGGWVQITEILSPFKSSNSYSTKYYLLDCEDIYGANIVARVDAEVTTPVMWEPITTSHYTHVEGYGNISAADYQHVQGKYNAIDNTKAFIIGNGTADNSRSNALTVDWSGNTAIAGDLTTGVQLSTTAQTVGAAINELAAGGGGGGSVSPIPNTFIYSLFN